MDTIRVRVAGLSDTETVLEMMEAFNAFERIPWDRSSGEPALRTLLADPGLGLVGLVEGTPPVLGYFIVTWGFDLEWNGRDAILTELFLNADARGRGMGKLVLARAEAMAAAYGAHALHLMVRHENEPARRLYASAGYTSPPRLFLTKKIATPA
jgi:GNAT superfamily N-acetyltransferase